MDNKKVSVGKPKVTGAVFMSPLTAPLPMSATEELSDDFVELGYASEDGVSNSNSPSTEEIKAWGLTVVDTLATERPDTFTLTLIESLNADVLKLVYGTENVKTGTDGNISVNVTPEELDNHAFVIDMILKGGIMKRIVIPQAVISSVGDVTYKDNELISYNITLTCIADISGNTHYEYISGGKGNES